VRRLDACPLCRSVLTEDTVTCPACGGDLLPYRDIDTLAARYVELARELLSRGDPAGARAIVEQLPQLTGTTEAELAELRARLAVHEGDYYAAEQLLSQLPPTAAAVLERELEEWRARRDLARELYNHSLSAARSGAFPAAADMLAQAIQYDPEDPSLWALKLKVDLKCGNWQRCYGSLARLDQLAARPPEFHRLEELLPPVSHSATGS
jgi:uncharacterized protein HemY